jgi:hypothetical protein
MPELTSKNSAKIPTNEATLPTGDNLSILERCKLVEKIQPSIPTNNSGMDNSLSSDNSELTPDPTESTGLDKLSASTMHRRGVFMKFVNEVAHGSGKAEKRALLAKLEKGELSMEEVWKLINCKEESPSCNVPTTVRAKSALYNMADENGSIDLKQTLKEDDGHSFFGKIELSLNAKDNGGTANIKIKF